MRGGLANQAADRPQKLRNAPLAAGPMEFFWRRSRALGRGFAAGAGTAFQSGGREPACAAPSTGGFTRRRALLR